MNVGWTLVVVAHPDDETLSFGGALIELARRHLPIAIVSLTNADNAVRSTEFHAMAASLGAIPVLLRYPDGGGAVLPSDLPSLDDALVAAGVDPARIGLVVTHSPEGNERRHPQHVQASRAGMKWGRSHHLPLGFFVEGPDPRMVELREAYRDGAFSVAQVRIAPRAALGSLARLVTTPPLPGRGLRARLFEARNVLGVYTRVRTLVRISVDVARKRDLLELYGSQVDGMRDYGAFDRPHEYLFVMGSNGKRAVEAWTWRS